MAQFFDLPLELRQEVYRLACLPEPAVYSLADPDILELPRATRASRPNKRTDEWRVVKRKYPTATHLCRESRSYVLEVQHHENARAARLGVQPLDYQIGQGQRAFDPEMDVVFSYSWRLLYALDRHVIDTFPFPDPFLNIRHIAMNASALTYEGHWLPFHHIFRRFSKVQNLYIVFEDSRDFVETRLSPQLARFNKHDRRKGSQEDLVCERIEESLKSPQLIEPEINHSNQLWSPTTQLVGMVLGAGHQIAVSAAQITVSHSGCHKKGQEERLELDSEWPEYSLLLENDFYADDWWGEELRERYGRTKEGKFTKVLRLFPCKWAVLTPLYYFLLFYYLL